MTYNIEKVRGNSRYYITKDGHQIPGTAGEKKKVLHRAAELNGMSYKEFLRARKEEGGRRTVYV